MGAEPDEFGTKLRWSVGTIAEHVGADRGCVFRLQDGEFTLTTEWTADGVDPRSVSHLDTAAYGWLSGRLEAFENVAVSDPADVPSGAAAREFLRDDGVRSAVILPMIDDWSLVGFVGFDVVGSRRRWGDSEVSVLRTAADVIAHSVARVRRERTLAEQNERLEAFASVISHDLRNPLNVVTGSIEVARVEHDSEHLTRAARAAGRMDDLIDQVLTLARQGADIDDTRRVRLDAVAERAWDAVDSPAAELRVGDDLGRVEADPDRLQEVFENLFRNSVEHGSTSNRTASGDTVDHAGADVTVCVGRSTNGFHVADDGPGIPPDKRESIFERGNTSGNGTGLGLAIVRRIVEAHGWSIRAGAAADGGARFDVTGVATPIE